jgi:hypothetical protein
MTTINITFNSLLVRCVLMGVAALAGLGVASCTTPLKDGESTCATGVCEPGQFCQAAEFCSNGCVSDANCLTGVKCVDINPGSHVGVCENGNNPAGEGEGEGETPPDNTCDGYATHAQQCGLRASEAEGIRQVCDQASANTKSAMIACNASTTCSEFLSCSGLQCFQDSDCPSSASHCLQRSEVVDPFNDVPYHCRAP